MEQVLTWMPLAQTSVRVSIRDLVCERNMNWMGTIAGRIGYSWEAAHAVYVKGGGAWADDNVTTRSLIYGPNTVRWALVPVP